MFGILIKKENETSKGEESYFLFEEILYKAYRKLIGILDDCYTRAV